MDKLDIEKLVLVSVDLSKLSNLVKSDVVKKTVLTSEVNNIDTSGFVLKTNDDAKKSDVEKKISDVEKKNPDASRLVKKRDYNTNINYNIKIKYLLLVVQLQLLH